MNIDKYLAKIDSNKAHIDGRRPLVPAEISQLDAYFRIGLTYSSNALEGNTLTISETKVLLEDGLTASGKPIKDCYEATGHAKAYDQMLKIARQSKLTLDAQTICTLHFHFYSGIDSENAGQYRTTQVFITGTEYVPPAPADVPRLMDEFVAELEAKRDLHPILLAAFVHRRLVDIHPFVDGNGRTARLLMNLILINKGYQIVSIPPILRNDYIGALVKAQRAENHDTQPFDALICECEIEAQRDYFRMFRIEIPKEKSQEKNK